MSTIDVLLRQVEQLSPQLAADLRNEVDALSKLRTFGLNFERHRPESVELPGRPARRGDKVRIVENMALPIGVQKSKLWSVGKTRWSDHGRSAMLTPLDAVGNEGNEAEGFSGAVEVPVSALVVVAEFSDPIFPGLRSTGKVERGGSKPFHTVINSENFHALQTLLYTHEGAVDAIYIDPPYNTGAKDWKYNNDYVDGEDVYRHSKWLAMMERRLRLARRLLKPAESVLIVTVDEKEYLRLGLLLEQLYPEGRIQMVTATTNPRAGVARPGAFTRTEEYIFTVQFGEAAVQEARLSGEQPPEKNTAPIWFSLMRTGSNSTREARPNLFYPIWVDREDGRLHSIGSSLDRRTVRNRVDPPTKDAVAIWPLRPDGSENTWQLGPEAVHKAFAEGTARINSSRGRFTVNYLRRAEKRRIELGEIEVLGRDERGALKLQHAPGAARMTRPKSVWASAAHDAGLYGSSIVRAMLNNRTFPFPKSLYAVEDTLRFFVAHKPQAVVLDFFAGSGTTAHAVMRLNKQDGGSRQSITVTNNEVSFEEQDQLRRNGFRPGDPEWEALGICEYITKPRIRSAITGKTPEGELIKGDYKFADDFPMSEGFKENAEFFELTYEAHRPIAYDRNFEAIAPLLWLRAGSEGARIERRDGRPYQIADVYAVLFEVAASHEFLTAVEDKALRVVYIVTDEERAFTSIASDLPAHVDTVRLYESYLTNFTINTGQEG